MGEQAASAEGRALALVSAERARQRAKWGDGGHHAAGTAWWHTRAPVSDGLLAPTHVLRAVVEVSKASDPGPGWLEILAEEVGEARDLAEVWHTIETEADPALWRAKLRAELVQVAAVAVAWLEDLERREAAEKGGDHG